jgi:hypothetical protein
MEALKRQLNPLLRFCGVPVWNTAPSKPIVNQHDGANLGVAPGIDESGRSVSSEQKRKRDDESLSAASEPRGLLPGPNEPAVEQGCKRRKVNATRVQGPLDHATVETPEAHTPSRHRQKRGSFAVKDGINNQLASHSEYNEAISSGRAPGYYRWSKAEVEALIAAEAKFGRQWSQIRVELARSFKLRTITSVMNKVHHMERRGYVFGQIKKHSSRRSDSDSDSLWTQDEELAVNHHGRKRGQAPPRRIEFRKYSTEGKKAVPTSATSEASLCSDRSLGGKSNDLAAEETNGMGTEMPEISERGGRRGWPWEEEAALLAGIEKCGFGQWRKIKEENPCALKARTTKEMASKAALMVSSGNAKYEPLKILAIRHCASTQPAWTQDELSALNEGIQKFGYGQWSMIRVSLGDRLIRRSHVQMVLKAYEQKLSQNRKDLLPSAQEDEFESDSQEDVAEKHPVLVDDSMTSTELATEARKAKETEGHHWVYICKDWLEPNSTAV